MTTLLVFIGFLLSGVFLAISSEATTCSDGTYSSSTGRGTCSWHGGIAGGGSSSNERPDGYYENYQYERERLRLLEEKAQAEKLEKRQAQKMEDLENEVDKLQREQKTGDNNSYDYFSGGIPGDLSKTESHTGTTGTVSSSHADYVAFFIMLGCTVLVLIFVAGRRSARNNVSAVSRRGAASGYTDEGIYWDGENWLQHNGTEWEVMQSGWEIKDEDQA